MGHCLHGRDYIIRRPILAYASSASKKMIVMHAWLQVVAEVHNRLISVTRTTTTPIPTPLVYCSAVSTEDNNPLISRSLALRVALRLISSIAASARQNEEHRLHANHK